MRGVFLDSATVHRHDLDLGALKSSLPDWSIRSTTPVNEIGEAIQNADIVISNKVPLNRETIQQAESLKLICVAYYKYGAKFPSGRRRCPFWF